MIGRRFYLGALVALAAALTALSGARADFTFTQGSGPTAFSFTATTGGTAICAAASTHCWASVPINAAGAALFITGNAGLVTGTGGTFPATQSGAWNITNISGTISLPTGAATATGLSTINTTLGSPFQAGGSIANTTFAATQSGTWTVQPGNTQNTTPWLTSRISTNTANLATWTTATAGTTNIDIPNSGIVPNTQVTLTQGTISGAVTFRMKDAAGNYVNLPANQVINCQTFAPLNNPYTLQSGQTVTFCLQHQGYVSANVQLSTAITGVGNLVVSTQLVPYQITDPALQNPLAAGTAIVGALLPNQSVNLSQVAGTNTVTGGLAGSLGIGGVPNITPSDCSGAIATGGTAQNALATSSTRRGATIANLDTTEPMWISFTGTAVAGAVGSYPLSAPTATTFAGLSSYTTPLGFGFNTALSVIAATSTHKFSCTAW